MTTVLERPASSVAGPAPRAWSRIGGLDGLRAIAVTAVVTYHLGYEWLPGSFLGVDLFFVISGFLITTLLLAELLAAGHPAARRPRRGRGLAGRPRRAAGDRADRGAGRRRRGARSHD